VIPQIVDVVIDKRPKSAKPYHFPKKCPCYLHTDVVREETATGEEGARARCTGEFACPYQKIQHLMLFVSRRAFDIDGLGEKQIELFFEKGWVKEPADIFTLERKHTKDLLEEEGYGETSVRNLFDAIDALQDQVAVAYVADYNMDMALTIIAGSDLWLNTPRRPLEASGTSGMKATHNGVPNFSVLDGWWIEGHIEGITGWSIGAPPRDAAPAEDDDQRDANDLYEKLERVILPLYAENRKEWAAVMKHAIGKNASYFNSHRMMRRYVTDAYLR